MVMANVFRSMADGQSEQIGYSALKNLPIADLDFNKNMGGTFLGMPFLEMPFSQLP